MVKVSSVIDFLSAAITKALRHGGSTQYATALLSEHILYGVAINPSTSDENWVMNQIETVRWKSACAVSVRIQWGLKITQVACPRARHCLFRILFNFEKLCKIERPSKNRVWGRNIGYCLMIVVAIVALLAWLGAALFLSMLDSSVGY